jgi:alpha-mannosidase
MDIGESDRKPVTSAVPVPIDALLNDDASVNFDGMGAGYAPELLPKPGVYTLGQEKIPFTIAAPSSNGRNNIACAGQTIDLPAYPSGASLYLLGSAAPGTLSDIVTLRRADGSATARVFALNDWVKGSDIANEAGMTFAHRTKDAVPTVLWIVPVALPAGIRQVVLPHNPKMHLFAATLAVPHGETAPYGLTVLNDSKYGSDTNGNVFRLTALRWSSDPDKNSDEGPEHFTYAILPHADDWRIAHSEQAGLALNVPLQATAAAAHPASHPPVTFTLRDAAGAGDLVAGALKHDEDGSGYILRFFETQGRDTTAILTFPQSVQVQEVNLLEQPIRKHTITVRGREVRLAVGHDQIVTLHIMGLPDAGVRRLAELGR